MVVVDVVLVFGDGICPCAQSSLCCLFPQKSSPCIHTALSAAPGTCRRWNSLGDVLLAAVEAVLVVLLEVLAVVDAV